MGKIQVLDEIIAARIAAGEVVERPASIVKELIENAIDAGATSIAIRIEGGGMKRIHITDNGSGIEKEDMPLTLIKHATSKIRTVQDLTHISSMGFRGEALFSVAAVSMLTIRSKTKTDETGSILYAKGGVVEYLHDEGMPDGTSITVENLFFNTPARLKFLKKPSLEASQISALVAVMILSNPTISFQYSSDGVTIYHSPGNGDLMDAVSCIKGIAIRDQLISVEKNIDGIGINGYISIPSLSQKRKNGDLFVNGRYVTSDLVAKAILEGYGQRLLKGGYPFYVLNLSIPLEQVDVNVHPNKLMVRFQNEEALFFAVSTAISEALTAHATSPVLSIPNLEVREEAPALSSFAEEPEPSVSIEKTPKIQKIDAQKAEDSLAEQELKKKAEESLKSFAESFSSTMINTVKQYPRPDSSFAIDTEEKEEVYEEKPALFQHVSAYRLLGVAFQTFIMVEAENTLYFIDQHAAHERLVFDKLNNKKALLTVQHFLASEIVTLSHEETEILMEHLDDIRSIGIDISPFGSLTFKIDALPGEMIGINLTSLLKDIAEELQNGKTPGLPQEKIAKAACKRAVKAGELLSEADLADLVKELVSSDTIPHCPHGRPVAIAITKNQLEKNFKRRL